MFFNFIKKLKSLSESNNIIVKKLGSFNYADCFEYQKKIQNEIIQIKLDNRNKRIKKRKPFFSAPVCCLSGWSLAYEHHPLA